MATNDKRPLVTLRNANILPGGWRDFSGTGRYAEDGKKRIFNVKLDEETAQAMANDGFNIKPLAARDEDDENDGYRIEIDASFRVRPPQIWMVSGGQRTLLDEGAVNVLDYADIEKATLSINPFPWEGVNGKGVKAYLHKAVIYLREDELDAEMRDIPISGGNNDYADIDD